ASRPFKNVPPCSSRGNEAQIPQETRAGLLTSASTFSTGGQMADGAWPQRPLQAYRRSRRNTSWDLPRQIARKTLRPRWITVEQGATILRRLWDTRHRALNSLSPPLVAGSAGVSPARRRRSRGGETGR